MPGARFQRLEAALVAVAALTGGVALAAAKKEGASCPSLPTLGDGTASADQSVTVHGLPGQESFAKISKAFLRGEIKPEDLGAASSFCALTGAGGVEGLSCKEARDKKATFDRFKFYSCDPTSKTLKALTDQEVAKELGSGGTTAEAVYMSFTPAGDKSSETTVAALRLEQGGSGGAFHSIPVVAVADSYEDSRYMLNLYTGVNLLSTAGDFSKAFGIALLSVETRFMDLRRGVAQPVEGHWYFILRGYAEGGLSSTATCTQATEGSTQQQAGCPADMTLTGTKTFVGRMGAGLGFVVPVGSDEHDTNAFSILVVGRAGGSSIPAQSEGEEGFIAFGDFLGLHIENESGHFAHAYFETGFGQSDQFQSQRTGRWKTDALIPFTDPNHSARLAVRFQADTVSPLAHLNKSSDGNIFHPGDIKISLLLNVDIRKFFDFLGGPGAP